MKLKILFALAAATLFAAHNAQAQDASQQVRVKVKKMDVAQQYTPDYKGTGVTEKRWRPKQWLEIDTEIDVDVARDLGGKEGTYPALDFKYFVALNAKNKEGKTIVLTGKVTFENIPASKGGDYSHTLAYVTPATMKGVLKKDLVGKADVAAAGVQIEAGGTVLAAHADKGAIWWIGADKQPDQTKFEFQDGGVIPKSKTPFAPLWADYDLQSKSGQ